MEKSTDRFTVLCSTFGGVVALGGGASTAIVAIALVNLRNITDAGMFAIAAMAAAPAALGIGVSLFLYLAFAVDAKRPQESFDRGAADQFIRQLDRPEER